MKRQLIWLVILLGACTYNDSNPTNTKDITLYDKPISTIKIYLAGKWKLNYRIGGLSGNQRTDYTNTFYEFRFQNIDIYIRTDDGKETINSEIVWMKNAFSDNPLYNLLFKLPNGVILTFYPKEIKSNILILAEDCNDCYTYYLMRSN